MPELVVDGIFKRLGANEVLKGVSVELERGEVVALLGPSGSGKTTLLRCVAGLERPDDGRIVLGDRVIFDAGRGIEVPAERRGLGLVFQSYALWPHRTVYDNMAYALRLRKTPEGDVRRRVEEVLERLGLGLLGKRFPHQLSGGQQQRVALGRALVYNPRLLLLDEPLSNLDAKLREEARAWLRELIVTLQISALYVTHDQVEALSIADRIVVLNEGRIEQEGSPEEIYQRPSTLFVADFMGSNAVLPGRLARAKDGLGQLAGDGWSLWGTPRAARGEGESATGLIRLERLRVLDAPGANSLHLSLRTSLYTGERWEHVFALGDFTVRTWGVEPLQAGDHWVEFPREHLWIF